MDKTDISNKDLENLFAWRDQNKDLVRQFPAPLKAIEIRFVENSLRMVCVRDGKFVTLRTFDGFRSLGNVKLRLEHGGYAFEKNGFKEDQRLLTDLIGTYFAFMALLAYYRPEKRENRTENRTKNVMENSNKRKNVSKKENIIYIFRRHGGKISVSPSGSHASPQGVFTVRGHYRHLKNGKSVWVGEYKKGTGKAKSKKYKIGSID